MSRYTWAITHDHTPQLEGFRSAVGIVGPGGAKLSAEAIQTRPDAKRFRMLCGNDEVMVEGLLLEITPGSTDGFEPLDDYGTGALGATSIEYLESGRWVRL